MRALILQVETRRGLSFHRAVIEKSYRPRLGWIYYEEVGSWGHLEPLQGVTVAEVPATGRCEPESLMFHLRESAIAYLLKLRRARG